MPCVLAMMNIRIITDSNACLAPLIGQSHAVQVIPNRFWLLGDELEDGDITADEMFERLRRVERPFSQIVPRPLPPQRERIVEVLQNAEAASQDVMAVTMTRYLSPTFREIERVAQLVQGVAVRVIDSHSVSMGLGLLVEEAVNTASQGATLTQVSRQVTRTIPALFVSFFAESMHYVQRSASQPLSQGLLGSLLRIKAMLTMEDGKLQTVEKVQTDEQLVEKLFNHIVEFASIRKVGILHHAYQPVVDMLEGCLQKHDSSLEVVHLPYPPSLAIHLGPDMIGVVIQEGDL